MKVILRLSQRGVPHMIVEHGGYTFSVCYFGKTNLYRIFLSEDENKKLLDVPLSEGGSFNLEFVLNGLIDKMQNEKQN